MTANEDSKTNGQLVTIVELEIRNWKQISLSQSKLSTQLQSANSSSLWRMGKPSPAVPTGMGAKVFGLVGKRIEYNEKDPLFQRGPQPIAPTITEKLKGALQGLEIHQALELETAKAKQLAEQKSSWTKLLEWTIT